MSKPQPSPWNLPNAITVVRILLVPLFIWLLVSFPDKTNLERWFATALYVLAIATDGLDGSIARRRGLVTNLGKILDPIADKALIGGALVVLSVLNEVSWWATALILVRELGITAYRFVVIRKRVIAASAGGKIKTIMQGIVLGFLLSPLDLFIPYLREVEFLALWLTVAVTLFTGFQYLWAARRVSN
ncbi:MAG: CDP-diacylglycerol--glycerol-3-phosphate 3-phosphatidyltransferase [Micrococcales bacterium]